ncbi:hypothetical protein ASD46_21655 [Rhizobium sp. Root491]|nr:hypothetical protein ASD46_21655 [Rhizobium sp. Root491]
MERVSGSDPFKAGIVTPFKQALAKTVQFKDSIRFDRASKCILRIAVSVIGVGMVHFEPLLIAALDFLGCRLGRKAECFESFGFQYLELSLLGADPRLPLPIGFASI